MQPIDNKQEDEEGWGGEGGGENGDTNELCPKR